MRNGRRENTKRTEEILTVQGESLEIQAGTGRFSKP
jgi:hypothetical protein